VYLHVVFGARASIAEKRIGWQAFRSCFSLHMYGCRVIQKVPLILLKHVLLFFPLIKTYIHTYIHTYICVCVQIKKRAMFEWLLGFV
jgi:hypothetical protein